MNNKKPELKKETIAKLEKRLLESIHGGMYKEMIPYTFQLKPPCFIKITKVDEC